MKKMVKATGKVWIVEIYSSTCKTSQKLESAFKSAARRLKSEKHLGVAAIDGQKYQDIARSYGMKPSKDQKVLGKWPKVVAFVPMKGKKAPKKVTMKSKINGADDIVKFARKVAKQAKHLHAPQSKIVPTMASYTELSNFLECSHHTTGGARTAVIYASNNDYAEAPQWLFTLAMKLKQGSRKSVSVGYLRQPGATEFRKGLGLKKSTMLPLVVASDCDTNTAYPFVAKGGMSSNKPPSAQVKKQLASFVSGGFKTAGDGEEGDGSGAGIALPQLGAIKGMTQLGGGAKASSEWKKLCTGQKKICVVLFVGANDAPEKKVRLTSTQHAQHAY
jgi:hypothetical protein